MKSVCRLKPWSLEAPSSQGFNKLGLFQYLSNNMAEKWVSVFTEIKTLGLTI